MSDTRVGPDPALVVAPVRPRMLGSFVERMGRCVDGGILDPEHVSADEDGSRQDALALTVRTGKGA